MLSEINIGDKMATVSASQTQIAIFALLFEEKSLWWISSL